MTFSRTIADFSISPPDDTGDDYYIDIGATTGLGSTSPVDVISFSLNLGLTLLGFLFLLLMLYGGFIWLKARGNDEEVERAKKLIEAAVIGLVLILTSYAVANFIFSNIVNTTVST